MKTRLLLIFSAALLINISLMSHILYAQISWTSLDDADGSLGYVKENNYLMITGIVY
jgi:hypothetical protein